MSLQPKEPRDAAVSFLSSSGVITAAVATIDTHGHPHNALVYFFADESLNFFFLTPRGTNKFNNVTSNPEVAVAIGNGTDYVTIQARGAATLLAKGSDEEAQALANLKNRLIENQLTWPIYQLSQYDDASIVVIKVVPKTMYYLNLESKNGLPITEEQLLKII